MDITRAFRPVLCFAVGCGLALAASGILAQEGEKASEAAREGRPAPASPCRPCTLTPQLLRKAYAQPADPMEICELMFDLSSEQTDQLAALAAQREAEMSRRAAEVDAAYVEKLGALLKPSQAREFSEAMAAVLKYRTTIAEATAELAAEGGAALAALAREGRLTTGKGLLRFAGLTPAQNAALERLEAQRLETIREGQKAIHAPQDTRDLEAMRQYREAVRALRAEADAQYETDLAELLTDAQEQKLSRLEQAVKKFQEKRDEAQRAFKRELADALTTR